MQMLKEEYQVQKTNRFLIWFQQIRGPFLILPVVLVLIGVGSAAWEGFYNWWFTFLLLVGVITAHISVNLFNELSDYKTKIDDNTNRTPFSGGSGMMQTGETSYGKVRIAAYFTFLIPGLIGIYFCVTVNWLIIFFMVLGAVSIRFYTTHLARWLIGEVAAGLTLGTMVVLGSHLVLTGRLTFSIAWISLPSGILTALLLLLNEFPDAEADKKGGRYHFIIHFGKATSAKIYVSGLIMVYAIIAAGPFLFNLPYTILIALLTLPLALRASIQVVKYHDDTPNLIPALALNVAVVILTDLFLALGFFL